MGKKTKIAVLVSGGVDSAVALHKLKNQGHEVTAFYLKIWLEDELAFLGECPWEEDLSYVRAVCDQLEVPLEVVSLQKEYWSEVVTYAIAEVQAGRTPNPDILCNSRIKFGLFFDKIDSTFEYVASGHYARVSYEGGRVVLYRTPDDIKDQTYFLSHLSQKQLQRVIFPIGDMTKEQVRAYAHLYDLPNKNRKDSQGICFLGKLKFRDFISHHLGEQEGDILEFETGAVVGKHKGFWFHTIGQRQGLGLGGGPWYVVRKDPEKNSIFISRTYYDADKSRNNFTIHRCNWFDGVAPSVEKLQVKLRHGAQLYECTLVPQESDFLVQLGARDQGIAAGQFAVFYDGNRCLGSGIIKE